MILVKAVMGDALKYIRQALHEFIIGLLADDALALLY
jgi:hypothetical protein